MSDSDYSPTEAAPIKPSSSTPLYLLAALTVAAALLGLMLIYGSPDKSVTVKQPAISVQQPAIAPAAVVAEPEPIIEEPLPVEHKVLETVPVVPEASEPEPLPIATRPLPVVDHAVIPADHTGPPWALNLMSLSNPNGNSEHLDGIIALGYTPEMIEVNLDGRHWLRVRIKGFSTIAEARKAGQQFIGNNEYRTLWIGGY